MTLAKLELKRFQERLRRDKYRLDLKPFNIRMRDEAVWERFLKIIEGGVDLPVSTKEIHEIAISAAVDKILGPEIGHLRHWMVGPDIGRKRACVLWSKILEFWKAGGRSKVEAERFAWTRGIWTRGNSNLRYAPLSGKIINCNYEFPQKEKVNAMVSYFFKDLYCPKRFRPFGHIICANDPSEFPDIAWQNLQSLRALRSVGVDNIDHKWLTVAYPKHVHVLYSRSDGEFLLHFPCAALSLRAEAARLNQEAGFIPSPIIVHNKDLVCERRFGRDRVIVRVQGPLYESDIEDIGWTTPTATAGTWSIHRNIPADRQKLATIIHEILKRE